MEKFNSISENELMAIDGGSIPVLPFNPALPFIVSKYISAFVTGFYNGLKS